MPDDGEPDGPPAAAELPSELLDAPVIPDPDSAAEGASRAASHGATPSRPRSGTVREPAPPRQPAAAQPPAPPADSRFASWQQDQARFAATLSSRLRLLRAVLFLLVGAFLLGGAWRLGEATIAPGRELAALTARGDATLLASWWRLDFDPRLLGKDGTNWEALAHAELCTRFRLDSRLPWALGVACRSWNGLPAASLLWSVGREMPQLPVRWLDAGEQPLLDLRLSRRAYRWLAMQPASDWPLLAQDEETRSHQASGSELDALLIRADEPLELRLEQWRASAPTSAAMAYDPAHPQHMAPVSALSTAEATPFAVAPMVALAAAGLALWAAGCFRVLPAGTGRKTVLLLATLALLPWWGPGLGRALGFLYRPAADLVTRLTFGGFAVPTRLVREPDWAGEADDVRRPINPQTSRYLDVLGGLLLARPPRAGSEDELLAGLSAAIDDQVERWPEDRLLGLLAGLEHHAKLADHSADLLVLDAVRRASLDERRSPELRAAASNVLFWVAMAAAPQPGQPAFEERTRLWQALYDHPDPAVRNVARK